MEKELWLLAKNTCNQINCPVKILLLKNYHSDYSFNLVEFSEKQKYRQYNFLIYCSILKQLLYVWVREALGIMDRMRKRNIWTATKKSIFKSQLTDRRQSTSHALSFMVYRITRKLIWIETNNCPTKELCHIYLEKTKITLNN